MSGAWDKEYQLSWSHTELVNSRVVSYPTVANLVAQAFLEEAYDCSEPCVYFLGCREKLRTLLLHNCHNPRAQDLRMRRSVCTYTFTWQDTQLCMVYWFNQTGVYLLVIYLLYVPSLACARDFRQKCHHGRLAARHAVVSRQRPRFDRWVHCFAETSLSAPGLSQWLRQPTMCVIS